MSQQAHFRYAIATSQLPLPLVRIFQSFFNFWRCQIQSWLSPGASGIKAVESRMLLDDGTQHRCKDENSFNCQHLVAPKCYVMIVDASEIWLTFMFLWNPMPMQNGSFSILLSGAKFHPSTVWRMWRFTFELFPRSKFQINKPNLRNWNLQPLSPRQKDHSTKSRCSERYSAAGKWFCSTARCRAVRPHLITAWRTFEKKVSTPGISKGAYHDDPPPPQSFECSIGPLLRLAWQLRMDSYK